MSRNDIDMGVLNNRVSADGLRYILLVAEEMAQDALLALKYDGLSDDEQDEKEQELQAYISQVQDIREHIILELDR